MVWLKKFIIWAYNNNFHERCTGTCCKNVWEAAVIINSLKKQKLTFDNSLIEMNVDNKFPTKPEFSSLNDNYKNLVFDDLLEEILGTKEQFINQKKEYRDIMIFLMRLFSYNQRLEQLEKGLLYNHLCSFYKENKIRIISG
jgi:hypothetical protein